MQVICGRLSLRNKTSVLFKNVCLVQIPFRTRLLGATLAENAYLRTAQGKLKGLYGRKVAWLVLFLPLKK